MEPTKTIKLNVPLKTREGAVLEEIVLPRPKVKDFRKVPGDFFEDGKHNPVCFLPMVESMTNIPMETLDELDVSDLLQISEVVADFLSESRQTGEK